MCVNRLQNNHCEFSKRTHIFKWLFCTENPVLNVGILDLWYSNPTIFKFGAETYLRTKIFRPYTTPLTPFRTLNNYFAEPNLMLKHTFFFFQILSSLISWKQPLEL